MLVNTLLVFIFYRMVELYNSTKGMSKIFNIGLFTGFVTLLYQPALVFVLMLPFSLFIMRPFRIREWLVGLLGITVPYYFLALEPLFTNHWSWKHLLPSLQLDFPAMPSSIYITISIILMVIPFIIGGFFVQANLNKMLIQIRKSLELVVAVSYLFHIYYSCERRYKLCELELWADVVSSLSWRNLLLSG